MEDEYFVRRMLKEAIRQYHLLSWYHFIDKARLQGCINTCKAVLGEN